MPHLILEHSPDVAPQADLQALCETLFERLSAHPAIPHPASLKIRTVPAGAFRIGTDPQSFVHATLLLLPGRDADTKSDLSRTILEALAAALPLVGSLSVNLSDLDPSYAKRVL